MASKTKDYYKGLDSDLKAINTKATKTADFQYEVDKLPYELTEAFRKNRDPELDNQINAAQQKVLGGAVEGLHKYEDIKNPFERRALAEGLQSTYSTDHNNLLSEKDRREGKFIEYIDKWTGLYGAEAARKQSLITIAQNDWSSRLTLADRKTSQQQWEIDLDMKKQEIKEDNRRYEQEFALSQYKAQKTGGGSSSGTVDERMRADIAKLKNEDKTWEEINKELFTKYDISQGGKYDVAMNQIFETGNTPFTVERPKDPEEKSISEINEEQTTKENNEFDSWVSNLRNAGYTMDEILEEAQNRGMGGQVKRYK